jgi:hypothetical protein
VRPCASRPPRLFGPTFAVSPIAGGLFRPHDGLPKFLLSSRRLPTVRRQFVDRVVELRRHAREHVLDVGPAFSLVACNRLLKVPARSRAETFRVGRADGCQLYGLRRAWSHCGSKCWRGQSACAAINFEPEFHGSSLLIYSSSDTVMPKRFLRVDGLRRALPASDRR